MKGVKVSFMIKGGTVIYIMVSKNKTLSFSWMRKMLGVLHTSLVSVATKQFIAILKQNSCYDLMDDPAIYRQLPSLSYLCQVMQQNPYTFLNCFLPLRLHPYSRNVVNQIVSTHREALQAGRIQSDHVVASGDSDPEDDSYYFGLLLLDETVVTIFKNNESIRVTPADVNAILNFIKTNQEPLRRLQPCFEEICLPGMTEEYKLPIFFKYDEKRLKTDPSQSQLEIQPHHSADGQARKAAFPFREHHGTLKLVFVCQDSNPRCLDHLSMLSEAVFYDLRQQNLTSFLQQEEVKMFNPICKCPLSVSPHHFSPARHRGGPDRQPLQ